MPKKQNRSDRLPSHIESETTVTFKKCIHYEIQCMYCGKKGSAAQLFSNRKRGQRSPEAAAQSRAAGKFGGYPSGRKRVEISLAYASNVLACEAGDGVVVYRGITFARAEAEASRYVAQRGGRTGITVNGARRYIRSVLKKYGIVLPKHNWGRGVKRGEMTMDEVAKVLVSNKSPGIATYQGREFSRASLFAYAEENGKEDTSLRLAKEYIRFAIKKAKKGYMSASSQDRTVLPLRRFSP